MPQTANELLTFILTQCQSAMPQPWYPSTYSGAGVSREDLDKALDELRLNNLIRLTDWVKDRGQGYTLTAAGEEVMGNPRLLRKLREGVVPTPASVEEAAPRVTERATPWQRGEAVRAIWLDPTTPLASRIMLWLNIAVFAWGALLAVQRGVPLNQYFEGNRSLADADALAVNVIRYETGAISTHAIVFEHHWWRFLTYMFVHVGVLHLVMNMFCVYSLGATLETMWGRWGFVVLYLVSGVGGGIGVILTRSAAAGASGAIAGMIVSTGVWLFLNYQYLPRELAGRFRANLGINLLLLVFISMVPGVSWQGHLGGAIGGAVVAVPLVFCRYTRGASRTLGFVGVIVVCLVAAGLVAALTTGFLSVL